MKKLLLIILCFVALKSQAQYVPSLPAGFLPASSQTYYKIVSGDTLFIQSISGKGFHYFTPSQALKDSLNLRMKRDFSNRSGTLPQAGVAGLADSLLNKVNKVSGKGLSSNDYTDAEKAKLSGIQSGATANQTDAYLLNRANHTGSQAISTVTGLQSALDSKISTETDPIWSASASATISSGNISNWNALVSGGPYLPLSAGSSKKLAGDLYLNNGKALFAESTSGSVVTVIQSDNTAGYVSTTTNHPLRLRTNNTTRYTIDVNGDNTWTGSGAFGGSLSIDNDASIYGGLTLNTTSKATDAVLAVHTGGSYKAILDLKYNETYSGFRATYNANTAVAHLDNYYQTTVGGLPYGDITFRTKKLGGTTLIDALTIEGYSGSLKVHSLAGSGDRFVITDSNGKLSTASIVTISGSDLQVAGGVEAVSVTTSGGVNSGGDITTSGNITAANLSSGTYTPTVTGSLTSHTINNIWYTRVGNVVKVSVDMEVLASVGGVSLISMSLPIPSNFTFQGDVLGYSALAPQGGSISYLSVYNLEANPSTDSVDLRFSAGSAGFTYGLKFSFEYIIK